VIETIAQLDFLEWLLLYHYEDGIFIILARDGDEAPDR
jgi:hypothetical protein